MKRIVSWVVGLLGVGAALAFTGPAGARTPARRTHSGQSGHKGSASGRQVYAQNCARCHGADGKGKSGPRLAGTSLSLGKIEKQVTDGGSKMPAFGKQLSPTQVKAVSTYVRTLGGGS
jgi:mono/diheme cytochrome c family protein